MAWTLLILAGICEVGWALGLRATAGFTRLWPSVFTGLAIVLSTVFLAQAVRTLPIGTAYGIWVGIGAVGAAIGGVFLYGEAMPPLRLLFVILLIVALIGLKLTSPTST